MVNKYKAGCEHCPGGIGLQYPLFDDKYFWIVCDVHPLVRGHILIIPKGHISCTGALSEIAFSRFKGLYEKVKTFIDKNYGTPAIFEHGITGQTVPHAHAHFLPFNGTIDSIVPETSSLKEIYSINQIKTEFKKNGKYLYTEVRNKKWLVNTKIGYSRFFRERFAKVLGAKERANWKTARNNKELMKIFKKDISDLKEKWNHTHLTRK